MHERFKGEMDYGCIQELKMEMKYFTILSIFIIYIEVFFLSIISRTSISPARIGLKRLFSR